jgi:hypothetical protein
VPLRAVVLIQPTSHHQSHHARPKHVTTLKSATGRTPYTRPHHRWMVLGVSLSPSISLTTEAECSRQSSTASSLWS